MPISNLCLPKGYLTVEQIDTNTGEVTLLDEGYNSLTKEAVSLLLGQLIGPSLLQASSQNAFPTDTSDRPAPYFIAAGPRSANSISFLGLGYSFTPEESIPAPSVLDTGLLSPNKIYVPITQAFLGLNTVKFVTEVSVTQELTGGIFQEAGLFTLGNNSYNPSENSIEYASLAGTTLFSRKTHVPVTANTNSILRYSWSLSMSAAAQ